MASGMMEKAGERRAAVERGREAARKARAGVGAVAKKAVVKKSASKGAGGGGRKTGGAGLANVKAGSKAGVERTSARKAWADKMAKEGVGKPKKTRDAPKVIGGEKKTRGRQKSGKLDTKWWRLAQWEPGTHGQNARGHQMWLDMGVDKTLHTIISDALHKSGAMHLILGDPPGTGELQKYANKQLKLGESPYLFDLQGYEKAAASYKKARPALDLNTVRGIIRRYQEVTGKAVSARAMKSLLESNFYKSVFGQDGKVK